MDDHAELIIKEMKSFANSKKAEHTAIFFKTGAGQYGEGDVFWGLTTPQIRGLVKKYFKDIKLITIQVLLNSPVHEQRSLGLLYIVAKFEKSKDINEQKQLVEFYLANKANINNWDLVDITAPNVLGAWSYMNNDVSYNWLLAKSGNLWEERISVVSTLYLIRHNVFEPTLALVEHFMCHQHDLMHKACGWMLREIGKHNEEVLTVFLDKYYTKMPRTMLRYSLERLSPEQKAYYMKK